MATTTYLARGAIDPKNTEPTPRGFDAWRGAIEPANLDGDNVSARFTGTGVDRTEQAQSGTYGVSKALTGTPQRF